MNKNIKLIIGLGNPDKEYENTYHNVGQKFTKFLTASKIKNYKLSREAGSRFAGKIENSNAHMNNSGLFVKQQLKKHVIKPENLLIVHDDADITLGNYKFSFGRGSAGHKGVQNIIDQLKTKNFWRLRIGIRQFQEKIRIKADLLVLKKISPADKKSLDEMFKLILHELARFS